MTLVDIVEKNEIYGNKHRSIRKSRNKMVKILAKLKSRNLPKFKFRNLSRSI